jgi:hypothetical protein
VCKSQALTRTADHAVMFSPGLLVQVQEVLGIQFKVGSFGGGGAGGSSIASETAELAQHLAAVVSQYVRASLGHLAPAPAVADTDAGAVPDDVDGNADLAASSASTSTSASTAAATGTNITSSTSGSGIQQPVADADLIFTAALVLLVMLEQALRGSFARNMTDGQSRRQQLMLSEQERRQREEMEKKRHASEAHRIQVELKEKADRDVEHKARVMAIRACVTSKPYNDGLIDLSLYILHLLGSQPPSDDSLKLDKHCLKGWLVKQGGFHKNWNKRWFVLSLRHLSLSYYSGDDEKSEKGALALSAFSEVMELKAPPLAQFPSAQYPFVVVTHRRTLKCRASSEVQRRIWVAICRLCNPNEEFNGRA